MTYNRGKGRGIAILRGLVNHHGTECVIWPMARDRHGYGQLGFEGRAHRAHRMLCEMVHGTPPSPNHLATHNCGKGHTGCINPDHLEWKDDPGNKKDAILHGTAPINKYGKTGKFSSAELVQIRAEALETSKVALSKKYEISTSALRAIIARRSYRNVA